MSFVTDDERLEVQNYLDEHKGFLQFITPDDNLLHSLRVIACLEANFRFSSSNGAVRVQKSDEALLPLKRWLYGENRVDNLKVIKVIIMSAFQRLDRAIQEHDNTNDGGGGGGKIHDNNNRTIFTKRMQNEQLINELVDVTKTANLGVQNLKKTYSADTNICALITGLTEKVNNRLELIRWTLEYNNNKNNNCDSKQRSSC